LDRQAEAEARQKAMEQEFGGKMVASTQESKEMVFEWEKVDDPDMSDDEDLYEYEAKNDGKYRRRRMIEEKKESEDEDEDEMSHIPMPPSGQLEYEEQISDTDDIYSTKPEIILADIKEIVPVTRPAMLYINSLKEDVELEKEREEQEKERKAQELQEKISKEKEGYNSEANTPTVVSRQQTPIDKPIKSKKVSSLNIVRTVCSTE
jgi:hypothetical protein